MALILSAASDTYTWHLELLRRGSTVLWQGGAVRFVLVHSPLVGPTTWRWVAEALESLGHGVAVPDLRAAARTGDPGAYIAAARSTVPSGTDVIVGHSGAGFFLPSIKDGAVKPIRLVFVDAGVPPCEGAATASADFLDQLRTLATDGMLPRWSEWWGEGVMERLVPDDDRRHRIEAELPEVPLAFYEVPTTVPGQWCRALSAFVLLSESYRTDAVDAISRGWPTVELLGAHLDIVNRPDAIVEALIGVL